MLLFNMRMPVKWKNGKLTYIENANDPAELKRLRSDSDMPKKKASPIKEYFKERASAVKGLVDFARGKATLDGKGVPLKNVTGNLDGSRIKARPADNPQFIDKKKKKFGSKGKLI